MYVRLCEGSVKNHVSDVCMHVSVPIFLAFIVHVCCSLAFQCILCVSAVCAKQVDVFSHEVLCMPYSKSF